MLNANGGQYDDTGKSEIHTYIRYSDRTSKFAEPSRVGYSFDGYNVGTTNQKMRELWEYGGYETTGVTLFGRWDPHEYEVRYDVNGGSPMIDAEIATYDKPYYVTNKNVTREGYKFDGWRLTRTNTLYQAGAPLLNPTDVDGDVLTFVAEWSPKNYTIRYFNGGGVGVMAPEIATYGVAHKLAPVTFTREGYTFNGWSLSSGSNIGIYGNEEPIRGSDRDNYVEVLDLYAAWMDLNAVKGTLILYGNTGKVNGVDTFIKSYRDGEAIGEITAKKEGYLFNRWATNSTTFVIPTTCNWDGVLSAGAEWGRQIRYNIIYHANDGTGRTINTDRNIEYEQDVIMKASNSFVRDNYKLIGWVLNPTDTVVKYECESHQSKLATEDGKNVHLYALWQAEEYDIIFYANDGTSTSRTYNFVYGKHTNIPANTFTLSPFAFSGWTLSSASDVYDIDFYDKHDADEIYEQSGKKKVIKLYAIWVLRSESVALTFDGNSGTIYGFNSITAIIRRNSRIKYPTAKKYGYHYTNWLDQDKVTVFNETHVTFTIDKTIYVGWQEGNYNLQYVGVDATGGSMTGRNNIPYKQSFKLDPNRYQRTGYEFKGWDTAENGRVVVYADEASVSQLGEHSETVNLYTVWGEKKYNVVYEEEGVRVATESLYYFGSHTIKAKSNPPLGKTYYYVSSESEGREFIGGESVSIKDFTTIGAKTDIILKLKTKKIKYYATFKANGGVYKDGSTEKKVPVYYGDKIDYPATPTNGAREFKGYKVNGVLYNGETYTFTADNTFEGNWDEYKYEVVFNKNTPVSPIASVNEVKGKVATQNYVENVELALSENTYNLYGYTFIGWATASYTPAEAEALRDSNSPYIIKDKQPMKFNIPRNAKIDLYALWTRNRINVRIVQNETKASIKDPYATVSYILYDQLLSDSTIFVPKTRAGYKPFTGMFTTKNITSPYDKKNFKGVKGVDYFTVDTALRSEGNLTVYPLWLNEEYQVLLDIGDGKYDKKYDSMYVTMYYDEPFFTKGSPSEPRNADGSLISPKASDSVAQMFDYWSLDPAGTRKLNGTDLFLDPSITTIIANYRDRKKLNMNYRAVESANIQMIDEVYEGMGYKLKDSDAFKRKGYSYSYWKYETEKGSTGRYLVSGTIYPSESMTFTPEWEKSSNGPSGGGGGTGGSMQGSTIARETLPLDFVLTDTLPKGKDQGTWVYNSELDVFGYEISKNTKLAQILRKENLYNHYIEIEEHGTYRVKNGIFKIHYYDDDYFFAFDENGLMTTGFVTTTENAHRFHVDYENMTIKDDGPVGVAKYYFIESGKYKGVLWNQPITINKITYTFDEGGRVIEEMPLVDLGNGGNWEYEPEDDSWKYAVVDKGGKKEYAKNGVYEIKSQGSDNYYVFDRQGKMKTGFVQQGGKTYYLQEKGAYRGAVYTGPLIVGDNYYEFDHQGAMVVAMSLTQALSRTQVDFEMNRKLMVALSSSQIAGK